TVADPAASDMWVTSAEGVGSAELSWTHRPGRWSLLVATTDAGGAAPTLELTWPREVVTPWFRPGLWTGVVLVLLGAVAFVIGWRRSQATEPSWVDVDAEPEGSAVVDAPVPVPAQPEVPLTRRQLRELEAAQAAGRGARAAVPNVRRGAEAPVEVTAGSAPGATTPSTPPSATPPSATPFGASAPRAPRPQEPTPYVPSAPAAGPGGVEPPGIDPHAPSGPAEPTGPAEPSGPAESSGPSEPAP